MIIALGVATAFLAAPGRVAASATLSHMVDPNPNVYPKDFAFFFQRGSASRPDRFHLFYIRQPRSTSDPTAAKGLGHQTSTDLTNWTLVDSTILEPRNAWDNLSVWAPSIIAVGDTFFMYYTGVGRTPAGHTLQQIGLATSASLDDTTWTRISSPVFTVFQAPWASHDTSSYSGQQLRDPFVMQHPDSAGVWLMFFTAVSRAMDPNMVIGVARSTDLRTWRGYPQPLWNTDLFHNTFYPPGSQIVEAPHLFEHDNALGARSWWLFYSASNDPVHFQSDLDPVLGGALSDSTQNAAHWSLESSLVHYLNDDPAFSSWNASEYVAANFYWRAPAEYLAAYTGTDISIGEMSWIPGKLVDAFTCGGPSVTGVVAPEPQLPDADFAIEELAPGSGRVRLRLEFRAPTRARVTMMDVGGRRVRTLLDGPVGPGRTTVTWDGADASGLPVASGIYFARVSWSRGARVLRIPLLR